MRNTREDVIAAALGVLDAYGLEFCSMRRVAGALEVQPSALYHHVPNKQTLLALMADEIVRDVDGVDASQFCHNLRAELLAIRDGADVVATASAFRLGASDLEARLARMVGRDGARTLLLYTFGQAQATQTQLQAHKVGVLPTEAFRGEVPERTGDADELAGEELDAAMAASFDRGIAIILAGLSASHPIDSA